MTPSVTSTTTGQRPRIGSLCSGGGSMIALTKRELEIAAIAWDAAVASMRYEDGSPVEVVASVNPYRAELEQSS